MVVFLLLKWTQPSEDIVILTNLVQQSATQQQET